MNRSIKKTVWIVTALAMTVAGNACNSDHSAEKTVETQQAQAWILQYQANCAAGADLSQCAGAYGFQFNADGTYDVGPGPQAQHSHGALDADDFQALTAAAAGVLQGTATAAAAESCNGFVSSDTDYTLTLTRQGEKAEVLHKAGGDLCSARLDSDAAETLHSKIVELVDKYYPAPFPDQCLEAAAAVQALYPSVATCHVDADCGYVSADFTAISAETVSDVYVDNCSVVAPLPAANVTALAAQQAALQAALDKAQQTCGLHIARENCEGPKTFSSSAAPAVCQQGVCRVNPSLGL